MADSIAQFFRRIGDNKLRETLQQFEASMPEAVGLLDLVEAVLGKRYPDNVRQLLRVLEKLGIDTENRTIDDLAAFCGALKRLGVDVTLLVNAPWYRGSVSNHKVRGYELADVTRDALKGRGLGQPIIRFADTEYTALTVEQLHWLLRTFRESEVKYAEQAYDCDDYARLFYAWPSKVRNFPRPAAVALVWGALGSVYSNRFVLHAFNLAVVTTADGGLVPIFFEPQSKTGALVVYVDPDTPDEVLAWEEVRPYHKSIVYPSLVVF